ncbi:MAG: pilus assembly PilX N-terminal domain-containing protein [Planctomycetota bacterium]
MRLGPRARSRRGVLFIAALVLLAGMSVVIIALAHEVALELRMSEAVIESDQAQEIAKLGIGQIRYLANNDPDWRTTYSSGEWVTDKPACGGTFSASGIDPDGDLADCPIDPVAATSVASYRGVTRRLSATLNPPVHESMMFLAYASDEIRLEGDCRVYGDLCSKQVLWESGAVDHRGNIYAEKPGNVSDQLKDADTDVRSYETAPSLPGIKYDWFVARGKQISPPIQDGKYLIEDKVISPEDNPHGFASPDGIYYVGGDKELRIVRCHITATLVVLTKKKVFVEDACVHAPASPEYPALVMEHELFYDLDQNLSEIDSGVDFNRDGDKSDTFTPSITGVVYAKTSITGLQWQGGTNVVRFKGAFVSEKVHLIGDGCIFEQDPDLSTGLVHQFQGDGLELVTGSITYE